MATAHNPSAWIGYSAALAITPTATAGSVTSGSAFRVRATNIGLQVKQEVTYPELIDAAADNTAYQLAGQIVEGDVAFPLIHEGTALGGLLGTKTASPNGCGQTLLTSLASTLWQMAALRDGGSRLKIPADVRVVYPDNSDFVYPGCLINSMKFSVKQSAAVEVTAGFVGGTNENRDTRIPTTGNAGLPNYLSPARIVTWNDFVLSIFSTDGSSGIIDNAQDGTGIREFDCEIKNNVDRFFTFNGTLRPQDITAKKRQIAGSFKIMGRNAYLNNLGETNENRYTSDENIAFGYKIGATNVYWSTVLRGVIFQFEEMTVSPGELFETTVPWRAMGDCGFDYDAISAGDNTSYSAADWKALAPTYGYGGATRDTWPVDTTQGSALSPSNIVPFGNDWGNY